jgi:V8-like Glu-specific endopeptidase
MKTIKVVLALVVFAIKGMALPLPLPGVVKQLTLNDLPESFTVDYDFEGIVSLSNCSGSLVRFENAHDNEPAMVLTNGHCLEGGFLNPNEVAVNQDTSRTFTLLSKSANSLGRLNAKRLIYGTMTKTDMALYQLRETYSEIMTQFNIRPLTLASEYAETKTGIEILSGYWKRGYSCQHDGLVYRIKEGNWMWEDSIRYSQPGCDTIPGTSGSPIIEQGTKTVVGVNNTGNESGQKCTVNNPCEIDPEGKITYKKGLSYGQQISWIYGCLKADNELDLNLPTCKLPN